MLLNEGKIQSRGRMRQFAVAACAAVLAAPLFAGAATPVPEAAVKLQTPQLLAAADLRGIKSGMAQLVNENAKGRIRDQYIVVFKAGTSPDTVKAVEATAARYKGRVLYTYTSALVGFSAYLPPAALKAVRAARSVEYVEADQATSVETIQPPTPAGNPPAGLQRIDRRLLPLVPTYTYSETGSGVHAYVIDTGIRITHTEFGGRAAGAFTAVADGHGTDDCNGHGTNVAGIIGGATYGVAKLVNLYAVRVLGCAGTGTVSGAIAGVDWVTLNAVHPAVANMSLGAGASPSLDAAVTASIASGITYAVAAGNNSANACGFSPARTPNAITVGAIEPATDTRAGFSNFGSCLDLFAPGVNILSAGNASDTATSTLSGTSQATPHVAGVAARYLEAHVAAAPADVWHAIHGADDVATTPGWSGVIGLGAGSPNELLHWGAAGDGSDWGDPHLVNVNGGGYEFQSAGEFVALRDGSGMEIQTRQTPVGAAESYLGMNTCLSLNTAVAARVGTHRVTYQPAINGVPDPSELQLRIDGTLTPLGTTPIALSSGGSITNLGNGGIRVDFPDETTLVVTSNYWSPYAVWYLNLSVAHTRAAEGTMGAIPAGNWLPALPSGALMGAMPGAAHDRYVALYDTFAGAWRVTNANSLFDYKPGESTATFTNAAWPMENGTCTVAGAPKLQPTTQQAADAACQGVTDPVAHQSCVTDVKNTGDTSFGQSYQSAQQAQAQHTAKLDCPSHIYVADNTVTPDGMKGNGGYSTYDLASSIPKGVGKNCTYNRPNLPNWDPFIGRNLAADEASATPNGPNSWLVTLKAGGARTVTCPATAEIGPVMLYSGSASSMPPLPASWQVTVNNMQTLSFDNKSSQAPYVLRCNYHGVQNIVMEVMP